MNRAPDGIWQQLAVDGHPVSLTIGPAAYAAVAAQAAARADGVARLCPPARHVVRTAMTTQWARSVQRLTRHPSDAAGVVRPAITADPAAIEVDARSGADVDSVPRAPAVTIRIVATSRRPVLATSEAVLAAVTRDVRRLLGTEVVASVHVLGLDD